MSWWLWQKPHIVFKTCMERLQGVLEKMSLKLDVMMVWRKPTNLVDDCYFYILNITHLNRKNQSKWMYVNLPFERRHYLSLRWSTNYSVHQIPELLYRDTITISIQPLWCILWYMVATVIMTKLHEDLNVFYQNEWSDLIRDFSLSKKSSWITWFQAV